MEKIGSFFLDLLIVFWELFKNILDRVFAEDKRFCEK